MKKFFLVILCSIAIVFAPISIVVSASNNIYTDSISGLSFIIPEGWTQVNLDKEREYFQAKFVNHQGDTMLFGCIDHYDSLSISEKSRLSRSSLNFSKYDETAVADFFDVSSSELTKLVYSGTTYYRMEQQSSGISMSYLVSMVNGYIYIFTITGKPSDATYRVLVRLVNSVDYTSQTNYKAPNELDWTPVWTGYIFTLLFRLLPIIIYRFIMKKEPIEPKKAAIIVVVHSLLLFFIYSYLSRTPSAMFYGWAFICYAILISGAHTKTTTDNTKTSTDNGEKEQLKKEIRFLEMNKGKANFAEAKKGLDNAKTVLNGGTAELSDAQIVDGAVSLLDAKKNLSEIQYLKMYKLYLLYQKDGNEKKMYDYFSLMERKLEIIREFNQVAPYQKYSGMNEKDTLDMMKFFGVMDDNQFDRDSGPEPDSILQDVSSGKVLSMASIKAQNEERVMGETNDKPKSSIHKDDKPNWSDKHIGITINQTEKTGHENNMLKCPYCEQQLDKYRKYCPYCNAPLYKEFPEVNFDEDDFDNNDRKKQVVNESGKEVANTKNASEKKTESSNKFIGKTTSIIEDKKFNYESVYLDTIKQMKEDRVGSLLVSVYSYISVLAIIVYVILALSQFAGMNYVPGISFSQMQFLSHRYQSYRIVSIVYGLFLLIIAVSVFMARKQMVNFKSGTVRAIVLVYLLNMLGIIAHNLAITQTLPPTAIQLEPMNIAIVSVIHIILISLNYVYFKNRARYFVN